MKALFLSLSIACAMIFSSLVYAVPPVVTENVVVLQNTTASMCPSSYEGKGGEGITETTSGYGENNSMASPGIRSCTSCTFDPKAQTCTCAKCYDYFDD